MKSGANTGSSSSPQSGQKKKLSIGDIFLNCLPIPDLDDYPKTGLKNSKSAVEIISGPGDLKFSWEDIQKATKYFSKDSIIGESRCSVVYKGELTNGTLVAVKRANQEAKNEPITTEKFRTEITTLQKISHNNLVGCYGYLLFEDEMIIVAEFVPNGNLRQHLQCELGKVLDFSSRLDIMIDIAHGLTYLHTYCNTPLIHRDVKSSNILITNSLHAKVADFGLARLASTDIDATFVHTMVKGTPGYVDPDYFKTNRLTDKSDVYSFGVVLVEIVTGKPPIDREKRRKTTEWVFTEFRDGKALSTLDPNLSPNSAIKSAVEQIYKLAFACLSEDRKKRPSMEECTKVLWSIRQRYNDSASGAGN